MNHVLQDLESVLFATGQKVRIECDPAGMRSVAMLALLGVGLAVGGGCSYTPRIAPVGPFANGEQLPLRIGVFYSPEFRDRQETVTIQAIETYTFELGAPSVDLFDRTFALAFSEVVEVPSHPPFDEEKEELVAVIEPFFLEFTPHYGSTNPSGFGYVKNSVTLRYGYRLYAMDGEELATWETKGFGEVSGQGRGTGKSYSTGSGYLDFFLLPILLSEAVHDATSSDISVPSIIFGEATEIAMSTAAHRFLENIQEIPEVQDLVEEQRAD